MYDVAIAELLDIEFLKFFIPLAGAVVAWFVNERRKRTLEEYQRKEQSYRELLRTFRAFYTDRADLELRYEFLHQLNVCWLYCPDEVINAAYAFLETIHADAGPEKALRLIRAGDFIAAIRRDMLARRPVRSTRFTGKDFRHYGARL